MNPRKKSRWADEKLYPTDLSEELCRQLFAQERRSAWFLRENAYAYARDGSLILHKRGGPKSVGMTIAEMAMARASIWTHNHPRISALSIDDIQRAFECQVVELRAVDPSWIYRLRDPDNWPAAKWGSLLQGIGAEIGNLKNLGVTDVQERNHQGLVKAAAAVGMMYSRTAWSPNFGFVLRIKGSLTAQIQARRH